MFDENEIIEFFNRIINATDLNASDIKTNVTKFYDYLVLTKMCDEETLIKLSKIVVCINEILKIKSTIGYIDIGNLLLESDKQKTFYKTRNDDKHYGHYTRSYVDRCSSGVQVRRC